MARLQHDKLSAKWGGLPFRTNCTFIFTIGCRGRDITTSRRSPPVSSLLKFICISNIMTTNILGCVRSVLSAVPWMAVSLTGYNDIAIIFTINVMTKWRGNGQKLSKFKVLAGIPQTRHSYRKKKLMLNISTSGKWLYVASTETLVKLPLGTASQHVIHFSVYHTSAGRFVMSVCPYVIIPEPRNGLPWNLILENLTKTLRHIPTLGKTGQQ